MHTRCFLPGAGASSSPVTCSVSCGRLHVTLHAVDSAKIRFSRVVPLRGQPTMKQVDEYRDPAARAEGILNLKMAQWPSMTEAREVAGLITCKQ